VLPPSGFRFGRYAAVVTISVALALMLVGLLVSSLSSTDRLLGIGVGAESTRRPR